MFFLQFRIQEIEFLNLFCKKKVNPLHFIDYYLHSSYKMYLKIKKNVIESSLLKEARNWSKKLQKKEKKQKNDFKNRRI